MDKLIKLFPFMPEPNDSTKLILAIVFYLFVPPIVSMIIGAILGLTIILLPLSFIVGLLSAVYTMCGIVFAILRYTGQKI